MSKNDIDNIEVDIKVWPDIFRSIGPGDDLVVSEKKLAAYIAEQRREAVLEEFEALLIGAYHAPLESPETAFDTLVKQRIAELEQSIKQSGGRT